MLRVEIKNDDLMLFKFGTTKQQHIDIILDTNVSLKIGAFLIPEFVEYIGFSIDELKVFNKLVNEFDDTHKYLKIIYDSYLKNGSFTLTDEQLNEAYKEYKKYR